MGTARDCDIAVIVAPREMQRGEVIVRDMKRGTERTASYQDVADDPNVLGRLAP